MFRFLEPRTKRLIRKQSASVGDELLITTETDSSTSPRHNSPRSSVSPRYFGRGNGRNAGSPASTSRSDAGDRDDWIPSVGDMVEITSSGQQGVVRYIGSTEFSSGIWVGIELNESTGKNNGTVHGVAYFECDPFYGLFVRPSHVMLVEDGSDDAEQDDYADSFNGVGNGIHDSRNDHDLSYGGLSEVDELRSLAYVSKSSKVSISKVPHLTQDDGFAILSVHREHIDDILEMLRKEMEVCTTMMPHESLPYQSTRVYHVILFASRTCADPCPI